MSDTIFALSSGAGRAGVAVFRLSGPWAQTVLTQLTGIEIFPPRQAALTSFRAKDGSLIDRGLAIVFPGPRSFTGEDVVELHVHGGGAIISAFIRVLSEEFGLRLAEPGEFTRRAFDNGKLDLTQAEGLADLIDAETEAQRRQALEQYSGALGARAMTWRNQLIDLLALVEAEIDFPDEDDVPANLKPQTFEACSRFISEIETILKTGARGRMLRDGIPVAIIGAPNAGKSTLLNTLAQSDVAIVSDEPGTTRDVIEVRLDLKGLPVRLADTAGVRDGALGGVEREGIRRAVDWADKAAFRILVVDGSTPTPPPEALLATVNDDDFRVRNKADLLSERPVSGADYLVSAKTGEGVQELLNALAQKLNEHFSGEAAPITRQRHEEALRYALSALARAKNGIERSPELVGEDIRLAARAMDRIVGRVDVEDVLGAIFSRFCIGK